MTDTPQERHEHAGKSSKKYLVAEEVLQAIGLGRGDVLLDVGCANGFFSLAASRVVGAEGRVIGVDNHEESIAVLREEIRSANLTNIEAIAADVTERIPVPNDTADVCLMADVLHGFFANGEIDAVMKEVARSVRRGGRLAIVEFKKVEGPPGPPLAIRLAPDEAARLLVPYGFTIEANADIGPHHYLSTYRKTGNAPPIPPETAHVG